MLPLDRSHDFPGVCAGISLFPSCSSISRQHEPLPDDIARRSCYTWREKSESIMDRDSSFDTDHILHSVQKKRRLTNEQAKHLEVSFELESRLEPDRKNQIAQQLGLQPRQVAIWFQNRRARCKTKHLEQEYQILKQQYNVVRLETDKLVAEVARLRNLIDTQATCGSELVSADQEQKFPLVLAETPSEHHMEQDHSILHAENRTLSGLYYQRCLGVLSDCSTSRQMNFHGLKFDNSIDLGQTKILDAGKSPSERKYISQKHDQHSESKSAVADGRCSSQLLGDITVKVEDKFILHDEIMHMIDDQAYDSAALCFNWQRDA